MKEARDLLCKALAERDGDTPPWGTVLAAKNRLEEVEWESNDEEARAELRYLATRLGKAESADDWNAVDRVVEDLNEAIGDDQC